MLYLDGSKYEGGGQILRTALALSTLTKTPFEMHHIRKGRKKPGLKNQHLHCIKVLEKYCKAKTANANLGSDKIMYIPGEMKGGQISIDIGTAGSITLMLQSLMLPALFAPKPTIFKITGGTDVTWSPQIDYLNNTIIPHLLKYAEIQLKVEKRGYYPKGSGKIELRIKPKFHLNNYENFLQLIEEFRTQRQRLHINLMDQGKLLQVKGISHASQSLEDRKVADRQKRSAQAILAKLDCPIDIQSQYCNTLSPGSGITLWARFGQQGDTDFNNPVILGSDILGEKGITAEDIGKKCAQQLIKTINSKACVDTNLADNLIPYMIFKGQMTTPEISNHTKTNIWTVEQFLGKMFKTKENIIKV